MNITDESASSLIIDRILVREAAQTNDAPPFTQSSTGDVMSDSLLALGQALASPPTTTTQVWSVDDPQKGFDVRYANSWAYALKRVIDVCGAAGLIIALSPFLLACAFLVKVSSRGPVLYRHRRLGYKGRTFAMWKFRTMHEHGDQVLAKYFEKHPVAHAEWLASHKLRNDPRVTAVGKVLRRLSLDELPQFWNVLAGEMSLIGPRPIVAAEIERYGDRVKYLYAVRPGCSGLWQISGRSNTTYSERIALDQKYVNEWSLLLDCSILLKTFRAIVGSSGAY